MATAKAPAPAPAKPRKPRVKREPSELSIAIKSVNTLKKKKAAREKLVGKIEALDDAIVGLQTAAAENMKTVNDIIYGPDPALPAGA